MLVWVEYDPLLTPNLFRMDSFDFFTWFLNFISLIFFFIPGVLSSDLLYWDHCILLRVDLCSAKPVLVSVDT